MDSLLSDLSENTKYRIIVIPPTKIARSELLDEVKKLIFLFQNGPHEGASQFNPLLKIKPGKFIRDWSWGSGLKEIRPSTRLIKQGENRDKQVQARAIRPPRRAGPGRP
jgi:hypothetical protein